jgi:hypothetical protein
MLFRGRELPDSPKSDELVLTAEEQNEVLKIARERIAARKKAERHELAVRVTRGLDNRPGMYGRRFPGEPNKINVWTMILSDETIQRIDEEIRLWETRHLDYDD